MRRPLIGLTPSLSEGRISVSQTYMNSVYAAGGYPVALSTHSEGAEAMDGFVFTGGVDIDPKHYGEAVSPTCKIDSERDEFERRLFDRIGRKPILGICRGIQVLNVFMGGTLYQDIPTEFPSAVIHAQSEAEEVATHHVILSRPLSGLFGRETVRVNSFHHQAVKTLAPGLAAAAHSEDGLIEALYATESDRFLWGVQWHPEGGSFDGTTGELFKEFIRHC